jgi:hypothetical protein
VRAVERSLLRRVARYGTSQSADPRENRLTEVFAAVLAHESMAGLAAHVAAGWLRSAQERFPQDTGPALSPETRVLLGVLQDGLTSDGEHWKVEAATQFSFSAEDGGRRPDLILRFFGNGRASLELWVEVKHGTGPHDHQLQAYAREIRRRAISRAAVLMVAPRSGYAGFKFDEMPDDVARLTWEDTGRLIESFAVQGPIGEFLRVELARYLREEGLMDPADLGSEHLAALDNYHAGRQVLDRVCELAGGKVGDLWNTLVHTGHWPRVRPSEYWWSYPVTARDGASFAVPEGVEPGWELLVDGAYLFPDAQVGVPLLYAGLSGPQGWVAKVNAEHLEDAGLAGFRVYRAGETKSRKNEYVISVSALAEIFTGGPVPSQAELLAQWANRRLRKLADVLAS